MLKNDEYLKNYALVFINIGNEDLQHCICLGPIVFFQKVWKEKSWTFTCSWENDFRTSFIEKIEFPFFNEKKIHFIFKRQK